MKQTAKQVRVRRNPCGMPVDEDFELVEVPLPEPAAGELLVRTIYVSLDPYMRGGMGRPEAIGAANWRHGEPGAGLALPPIRRGAVRQSVRRRVDRLE